MQPTPSAATSSDQVVRGCVRGVGNCSMVFEFCIRWEVSVPCGSFCSDKKFLIHAGSFFLKREVFAQSRPTKASQRSRSPSSRSRSPTRGSHPAPTACGRTSSHSVRTGSASASTRAAPRRPGRSSVPGRIGQDRSAGSGPCPLSRPWARTRRRRTGPDKNNKNNTSQRW